MNFLKKIFLFSTILIVFYFYQCKKSKISPCCWGQLEDALFWIENNYTCKIGIVKTSTNVDYINGNNLKKIPEEFRNLTIGDTITVKVKFEKVNEFCTQNLSNRCDCGGIKIKCIQKK